MSGTAPSTSRTWGLLYYVGQHFAYLVWYGHQFVYTAFSRKLVYLLLYVRGPLGEKSVKQRGIVTCS